jgi:DNA-directed RNA polymerase specialized sigma24 family protein
LKTGNNGRTIHPTFPIVLDCQRRQSAAFLLPAESSHVGLKKQEVDVARRQTRGIGVSDDTPSWTVLPRSPQEEIAPMDASPISRTATLSHFLDEELIQHTRGPDRPVADAARQILHARHLPWATTHVIHVARKLHLSAEDVEEAQQETLFGLNVAIDHFEQGKRRTFQSFVRLVLGQRVCTRVKRVWTEAGHYAGGIDPDELSDDQFGPCPRAKATCHDPAQMVIEGERLQAIANAANGFRGMKRYCSTGAWKVCPTKKLPAGLASRFQT